jgi:hypothetical protein
MWDTVQRILILSDEFQGPPIFNGTLHISKKFWEELIVYFPLIQYGQHRKRKKKYGGHTDSMVVSRRVG